MRKDLQDTLDRIASTRESFGLKTVQLKSKFDVPARLKHSVVSYPMAWFGGSLGAGLLTTKLFRRKNRETRKKSWLLVIATTLFSFIKPSLKNYALRQVGRQFQTFRHQFASEPKPSSPPGPTPISKP